MRATCLSACTILSAALAVGAQEKPKGPALEGTWEQTALVKGGERTVFAEGGRPTVTFKGGQYTHRHPSGRTTGEGTYTLDEKANPPGIDLVHAGGALKGKTMKGVYEIKNGELRMTVAQPGRPRPKKIDESKDAPPVSSYRRPKK